jgi:tripartite-type tricarboxylate transporter receptor subunit TctC
VNRRRLLILLQIVAAVAAGLAQAQTYPDRPITLLVGGAPGSAPDAIARPIAERLGNALGQAVVVENRPGAAGSIAMVALKRSAPDGYTLALATMSQAVFNPYLFANPGYDPLRDLEPIAPLVTGAMALAAHPSFPPSTLTQFVALAKAEPGKLFVAIPQLGSPPHIVLLLLSKSTGIDVTVVPHKSGSDAVAAVVAGEIPLLFDAPTVISGQAAAGKLKAITVTGKQREAALPATATASESGFDVQGDAWIGLVAPAGTPPSIVERLNREVARVMAAPEMNNVMTKLSFQSLHSTPQAFRDRIRSDHAKWSAVIRDAGLKLE